MSLSSWSADVAPDVVGQLTALLERRPTPTPSELCRVLEADYEQVDVPLAYVDRDFNLRHVNPAYERSLDRPHGSLVGQNLRELSSPQAVARLDTVLMEARAGRPVEVEAPFRDPGGVVRVVRRYLPHASGSELLGLVVIGERSQRNRATVDRLTLLHALATGMASAENARARSECLLATCADYLRATAGVMAVLDDDLGPGLWTSAHFGEGACAAVTSRRIEAGQAPLLEEAFARRWPQTTRDPVTGWITAVALPLMVEDRALGVIACSLPKDRWLDDGDRAVLLALSEQGAQALERARLFDGESRARSRAEAAVGRLRFLSSVSRRLALAPMEPDAVMNTLAASLVRAQGELGLVHLVDPDGSRLTLCAAHHRVPASSADFHAALAAHPLPLEGSLVGEVVRTGRPLLFPQLEESLWGEAGPALHALLADEAATGQLLVIPLVLGGRVVAALSVLRSHEAPLLEEEDISLVQKLGDRAIIAFGAARAFEAERRARERAESVRRHFERMHELTGALGGVLTATGVMRVLVERGLEVLGAASGLGVLPDLDRWTLERVAHAGFERPTHSPRWRSMPLDAPLPVAEAYRRGSPLILEGQEELLSRFPALRDDADHLAGIHTLAVFPLRTHEGVLGVLAFSFTAECPYVDEDRAFLSDLGRHGSMALERAGLYEAQARAVGDRDEFLSIASHELRTPLTPLHLKLELLSRELTERVPLPDRERLLTHVQVMRRQVRRMGELVHGMLDLSRIDSGLLPLEVSDVSLIELVREVVSRHEEEAARAGCETTVVEEAPGRGRWDRSRIEQVVTNLLTNALKYGAGRPVVLRVGEDAEFAWLEVEDRGIGIDAKEVPRLFQRFARAVSERHYGGLGLGLYITRRIAESHGGSVLVRSVPGEGSCFRVTLPLGRPSS